MGRDGLDVTVLYPGERFRLWRASGFFGLLNAIRMDPKGRDNFLNSSVLVFQHSRDGLADLVELNVSLGGYNSFENFINDKQHDIYHMSYNSSRCCQCPPGYVIPRSRILHPSQLEVLLDKNGSKKTCHNPGRTADFCCCFAHRGLTTNVLDVTLARWLIINFCQDVFWYSCLTAQKLVLEDFLTRNQHHIYHLYEIDSRCCQCPPNYVFPTRRQLITKTQWNQLYSTLCLPCPLDRKRPAFGRQTICASSVTPGLTVSSLGSNLSQVLIDHCCPLKQKVEQLARIRNNIVHHVGSSMSENEYVNFRYQIETNLLYIGQICNKQSIVQQNLKDLSMTQDTEEFIGKIKQDINNMDNIRIILASQDLAERHIEEKRQKLLETTKSLIKEHVWENTFIQTNAVNLALAHLGQKGIVILIGPPGIGKSRTGLELLRQISMENDKYVLIRLDDISQWLDMCHDKDVVFIDDVFGRTNCSYSDDDHSKLLEMIFTTVENGNVKVIFTLRNNIYQQVFSRITKMQRIFLDQHVLDLSKHLMTEEEKKICLKRYFAITNILLTDDIKKENINDNSILDSATKVYIHNDTLQKIFHADIGTHVGFPEICCLFASCRKFTRLGHNFFCHPTERLQREIDNLRIEGDTNKRSMLDFTLLVYILLNGDSVNINDVDQEALLSRMETIYSTPLSTIPPLYINDSANRLLGKYLKIDNDGHYCFEHRLILEAVMISYNFTDPERVIPLLGFDFITEMARPQNYKKSDGEVIFTVPQSCYSLLAQRLLQLLDTDYNKKPYLFVQNLCKSKIIKMTGDTILQEMIVQYKTSDHQYNTSYNRSEALHDHRISSSNSLYYMNTSLFYFPSAILMFCNIDNDSVYQCVYDQCVYDNRHNTLESKHDNDVMEACKQTLVWGFHFAVCTLDLKRSAVILNVLTDHNIKLNNYSTEFCARILKFQGASGLRLLFSLPVHDLSDVFNITSLISVIIYLKINIDENMSALEEACRRGDIEGVKKVLNKFDQTLLDMKTALNIACEWENYELVKWMCQNVNRDLLNMNTVMVFAYKPGHNDLLKWLFENFDQSLFEMKAVMDHKCRSGDTELVKWLFEKFDNSLFDVNSAMKNASQSGNIDLVKWLFEKFDVKSAMDNACRSGDIDLVKWLFEKFDNSLFDVNSAMDNACRSGNIDLVKWLFEKFDNSLFDVKSAMDNACRSGNIDLVKWLFEKFDTSLFDVKSAMDNASRSGDIDLVKWLLDKFDPSLFDVNSAMDNASRSGDIDLVKWLFEKFDPSFFDVKSAMHNASRSGHIDLVKWLLDKFDTSLFYLKSAMDYASRSGHIDLVKWLFEKFDPSLFDVKSAMDNASRSGNIDLVKLLFEKFDPSLFDVKSAMDNASRSGDIDLVKWLFEKFDPSLFDVKSAMDNASRSGDIDLVKWLLDKFDTSLFYLKSAMDYASRSGHIDLVKWLFEKFDPSLFYLKSAMDNASRSGHIDLVKWLFEKFDPSLFDVKSAMDNASRSGHIDLVKLLFEKFDPSLFDVKSAIDKASRSGNIDLVKLLFEKFDPSLFDVKTAMDNASRSGDIDLVKWLFEKFDPSLFDVKSAMDNASRSGHIDLVKLLFEKFDTSLLYLKSAMDNASRSGDTELVKWLFKKFDNSLFYVKSAMDNVSRSGNIDLVKWLFEKFDNSLFDVNSAMDNASRSGNIDLVKLLFEKFDNSLFDVNSAMQNASRSGDIDLVKWLFKKFDNSLFYVKSAMDNASRSGNIDLVKWLFEKFDNSLFDVKSAMDNASRSGDIDLVKWLFEKFDNSLFDVNSAMQNASRSGDIDLVKWLFEKFDNSLFDVKSAMDNASRSGDIDLVKWLFEKFDPSLFDVNSAMDNASRSGNIDLVKLLFEKFDTSLFDVKSAMDNASRSGDIDLVKWLFEKFDPSLFDVKSAIDNASGSGHIDLVKLLFEKFDPSLFDVKSAMDNASRSGNIDLVKLLFEKFDTSLFYLKSAMDNASRSGDTELVKWLFKKFDTSLFDVNSAMDNACRSGNIDLVKWLFEKFDNSLFDVKSAMENATRRGDIDLVKWLFEKFDPSLFYLNSAMQNASRSGDIDLVKWLFEKFDNSLFDVDSAMQNASRSGNIDLVKCLFEKFDNSLFDVNSAMENAYLVGDIEIVKWLFENVDSNLFDLKSAVKNASRSDDTELIEWLTQKEMGLSAKISPEVKPRITQSVIIKERTDERRENTMQQHTKERFYLLSIQCDGILVDCIVDKRIQSKYCDLYNDMEHGSIKAMFNETEFYMENRKADSDLPCITTSYGDFETLYTYSKIQTRQTCEIKLLKVAVKKGQDLVCRWLLSHCSDNRLVFSIRPTKDNPAICRILSWTYTKLFCKQYPSSLNSCLVWPGTKCICRNKEDDTKTCFKKGRLVIVVESKATVYGLPPKFSSFRIQQITPEIRSKALREASTILKIKLDSNSYYLDKYIPSDIAEELFKKHRNLSLVCPSQYKSQGYYRKHTIASSLCLQMFCQVKGIVPVGEEHFPGNIDGLETDVLEGCPSLLATNIRIGNAIGTFTNHGTLGGFCNYMGRPCFLTCAHVMYDVQDMLKAEDYLHRNKPVKSYVHTQLGPVECGSTIRRVFDHDNSEKTSIDAALVEIHLSSHSVDPSDCVCNGMGTPIHFQSLGMTTLLLEDNCLDHRQLVNQPTVPALAVGAISQHQQNIIGQYDSDGIDINFNNIGQAQAQVNGVNYQPLLLVNNAHMQVPVIGTPQGQRIFRMYNQMVVNIPLKPGDSGTCIYITGCPAGCGCIGMAIAHCNGFAVVTPLTEILRRL